MIIQRYEKYSAGPPSDDAPVTDDDPLDVFLAALLAAQSLMCQEVISD